MINYLKYASKSIKWKKYALKTKKRKICIYMHNKMSKLDLWKHETYLFRTLLFLSLCKKNIQMLQVFCPIYKYHDKYEFWGLIIFNSYFIISISF
jgi:uncharacterized membrane protein